MSSGPSTPGGMTATYLLMTASLCSFAAITWIFGFLVTIPGNENWIYLKFTYAVIFCVLNASLGLQIFVVYILITKSRRKMLNSKLGSIKRITVKESTSTSTSSGSGSAASGSSSSGSKSSPNSSTTSISNDSFREEVKF